MNSRLFLSVGLALLVLLPTARAFDSGTDLARIFVEHVDRRLNMPAAKLLSRLTGMFGLEEFRKWLARGPFAERSARQGRIVETQTSRLGMGRSGARCSSFESEGSH
jgi:hypothetical protein